MAPNVPQVVRLPMPVSHLLKRSLTAELTDSGVRFLAVLTICADMKILSGTRSRASPKAWKQMLMVCLARLEEAGVR